jgi:hypothetical protein
MEVGMRRFALLAVVVFLAACQTASYEGNENSPYYQVPAGSRLILRQAVEIPPYRVGIFLQGGQIKPLSQINQYYPHCKFEVWKIRDLPQPVKPDEFTITKVVQEITDSVSAGHVQLARVSIGIGVHMGGGDDGASVETYATRLNLRSEKQPGVFRLSCGQWSYPAAGQHVSIREMRVVLGDVFTLQLAPGKR